MNAKTRRAVLPLLIAPLLPGCATISAVGNASRPLEIYELRTPAVQAVRARRQVEVVVEEPTSSGALATERIMVRPSPLRAQYLPGVRWADTAPLMLQTLLLRGLAGTEALTSVGRRPVGSFADYAVLSELTDFQAEQQDSGEGALVRVRLIMRIVRERDARVVAIRTFDASALAGSDTADGIAASFDQATSALLSDVIPWILTHAR